VSNTFDYDDAFSRNIGWVTEVEQQVLKSKRVAIAGVGGVGGVHLLTLTRLGIGNFHISDLDIFEQGNFNRQAGAYMKNVGRDKVEVMAEMAQGINPDMGMKIFPDGIKTDNIEEFLDGVDLYVDGLDFFVLDVRREVFAACERKGIPAITAAPLGMGTAFLAFMPGQMTFEEYFRMAGCDANERQLRFLLGLSPAMLQMGYLADESRVDLKGKKGPSTPMACELCAGVAATNALKVLLNRGDVIAAPHGLHFDAYKNTLKKTWRPLGNNNPIQRLMLMLVRKRFMAKLQEAKRSPRDERKNTDIERILDLARWAPSGDNTQPWRFEINGEHSFVIHAEDTRDWCVYDLDGHASQIAVGALLETIAIAATGEGLSAGFSRRQDSSETKPIIDVKLTTASSQAASTLIPYIRARVTQRRPFKTTSLSARQKTTLEAAVGEGFSVLWLEGRAKRWQMAKLLFRSAKIRLTTEEAYRVHARVIEWDAQYSVDRIPDQAVGVDAVTLKVMRWSLHSWQRVQWLNRYAMGTWLPRIQLDLLPGFFCGAHFVLLADKPLETIDDYLAGGRALQRFWLTSARLGLQFQPEMTPLIFSHYSSQGVSFSGDQEALKAADQVRAVLGQFLPDTDLKRVCYMGRLGCAGTPLARSLRFSVEQLNIKVR